MVFQPPDLRFSRIINMNLRIRAENNFGMDPGRLETGGYLFNSIADARTMNTFSINDIGWSAQFHEFDVTPDSSLLLNWPTRIAFALSFFPFEARPGFTGFVIANYAACELVITYESFSPEIPDTLQPNDVVRHPNSVIDLSWRFNKSPHINNDQQLRSILHNRVNDETWGSQILDNTHNFHSFPARSFVDSDVVEWRVQTVSVLGTSDFSETASFTLAATPPLAPLLIHPINVSVDAASGIYLEWRFNSQYELSASKYEIRYRFNSSDWTYLTTDGVPNVQTSEINVQGTVEWQVRATGLMGDVGPWSDIATFWTIGLPPPPTIVSISRTNRAVVTFSSVNIMSWSIDFFDENSNIVYETGERAFDGSFVHIAQRILPDGNYTARMRVRNEHGIYSDFAYLAFVIQGASMPPVNLENLDISRYSTTLSAIVSTADCISDSELIVYRSGGDSEFVQIAHMSNLTNDIRQFDDHTEIRYCDFSAGPGINFTYFVRLIGQDGDGFVDSNKVSARLDFSETVITRLDGLGPVVRLSLLADTLEPKALEVSKSAAFTHLMGRELPVLELGQARDRQIAVSHLCTMTDYGLLAELITANNLLCYRDLRFGTVIGYISGPIRSVAADPEHVIVGFEFVECDNS